MRKALLIPCRANRHCLINEKQKSLGHLGCSRKMFAVSDGGSQQWGNPPPKTDSYNKELFILTTRFCFCTSPQIHLLLGWDWACNCSINNDLKLWLKMKLCFNRAIHLHSCPNSNKTNLEFVCKNRTNGHCFRYHQVKTTDFNLIKNMDEAWARVPVSKGKYLLFIQ